MAEDERRIISTKCPILNMHFREEGTYDKGNTPDLEVLVACGISAKDNNFFYTSSIICPEYAGGCKCKIAKGEGEDKLCIYSKGFQGLK